MVDYSLGVTLAAVVAAVAAGWLALARPLVSLGLLFVLAAASRITLETQVGTMRLEQPAIAVVAAVLLLTGRWQELRRAPRVVQAAAGAFGAYLVVLTLASALVPPDPVPSVRLAAWQAISMVAGLAAFILARRAAERTVETFAVGGAFTGAIGLAAAVLFLVAGPEFALGIQDVDSPIPRVHAWSHEANLFASFLAICAPFAVEAMRRNRAWLLVLLLVVGGLPFGETRGAYIGFVAGIIAYGVVRVASERQLTQLPAAGAAVVATFVVGTVAASVLLPNPLERYIADTGVIVEPSPAATPEPGSSRPTGPTPTPEATRSPSPSVSIPPPPTLAPYPDTVAFRLERVPLALDDLWRSPFIGLGVSSFGQLHADPSQGGLPDHLAIMAIATLHDSGLLGSAALLVGFGLIGYGLWITARAAGRSGDRATVGTAAAYAGSLTAMLVAYQATNALHFALNWLIIGAAGAVVTSAALRQSDGPSARL